jgi:hypothetical protein
MQTALSTRSCSCSMRPASTSVSFRVPHMRSIRPFTAAPVHQQTAAALAVPSPIAPQRLLVCSAAAKDATEQVWLVPCPMVQASAAEQHFTRPQQHDTATWYMCSASTLCLRLHVTTCSPSALLSQLYLIWHTCLHHSMARCQVQGCHQ